MKLTYIANIRLPTEKAHGIQIMKTCEALADLGVEVELVAPTRVNLEIKEKDPFVYHQVKRNFQIKKLFIFDPIFLWKLPGGIYIKLEALFFLGSLFLYLLFQKDKPQEQIFYTRDEYLLPLLQRNSRKVVWEAHTLPQNANYYLRYFKKCHRIIAISNGLRDGLQRLGVQGAEDKILVAADGVDIAKFQIPSAATDQIRRELGLPVDEKIIMYTGHLYEWKGARTLLQTARNFQFHPPRRTKFVFVGGTDDDVKRFKTQAQGLDNVLILGHKPYAEIPKYLAAADVLVLPNSAKAEISRLYTSPLKLFEYLAARRPIVASDLPSVREILSQETAIFFIPDDARSLAEAIKKALQDHGLCARISSSGWQLAQNFTWQTRARKILGFIV